MEEPFEAIGKYYYDLPKEHKNGEFDVVTKDDRGYAFYEAKFREAPVSNAMVEKEIQQVNMTGLYCYRYGFFSKSGYDEDISRSDVVKYTLDDLYNEKKLTLKIIDRAILAFVWFRLANQTSLTATQKMGRGWSRPS